MNIDRYMVNLFFEIKRNIPSNKQTGMKISNPEIGEVITALYTETEDENIRLLTRIFLERAGENWLEDADKILSPSGTLVQKMRTREPQEKPAPTTRAKPKRIYRGQIVED